MSNFKKNQQVVRVISVMGSKTAAVNTVASVAKGIVRLKGDDDLKYNDEDGREIDPVIPGCSSEIIELE